MAQICKAEMAVLQMVKFAPNVHSPFIEFKASYITLRIPQIIMMCIQAQQKGAFFAVTGNPIGTLA